MLAQRELCQLLIPYAPGRMKLWYNTLKNPAAARLSRNALKICFADLILSLPYQMKSNAHFVRA